MTEQTALQYRFTSRKFLLAVGITLIATGALFFGKITGGEWVTTALAVMGLYGGANVMQRGVTK